VQTITKKQDFIDNSITFEGYLTGKDKAKKKFAEDLLKTETEFSVYKVNGENHFAPSKFGAIKGTTMDSYLKNLEKEAKDPKHVVTKVIGTPFSNNTIETKFEDYLDSLGLKNKHEKHTFWRVKDERGKNLDIKI
jgi:5-methylcytosine-specific restriction protein A